MHYPACVRNTKEEKSPDMQEAIDLGLYTHMYMYTLGIYGERRNVFMISEKIRNFKKMRGGKLVGIRSFFGNSRIALLRLTRV
jgi:hypothetical protein